MPRIAQNRVPTGTRLQRVSDCLFATKGPVSMSTLIAWVYGGNPPPGAVGSIRNAICLLRRAGEQIVFTLGHGYTILTR